MVQRSRMVQRPRNLGTAAAGAIAVAGMIGTPLARRGGAVRRALSTVVIGGLAGVSVVSATRRWGGSRAATAGAAVSALTLLVEGAGVRSGVPFGRYRYTGRLRPTVGGVPAVVPLAWFAMALPARETAHAALGGRSTPARRVVLGSAALTAWDLFLDPQMVGEGYWVWARRGRYRGIPASNFAGWFVTGLAVMALLDVVLPHAPAANDDDHAPDRDAVSTSIARTDEGLTASGDGAEPTLVGAYAYMAVMETLGFAAFFRDRVVAVVGGAGMLPIAAVATTRTLRAVRARRG
jgi:uncharacterized membrane protein